MTESGTAIVLRVLRAAYARDREEWTPSASLLRESQDVVGVGMVVNSRVANARAVLEREGFTVASTILGRNEATGRAIHAYRIEPLPVVSPPSEFGRRMDAAAGYIVPSGDVPALFGTDVGKGPDRWPRD